MNNNEIVEVNNTNNEVTRIDDNFVIESLKMLGTFSGLTNEQVKLACSISKEFQLNPLKREVHFVAYNDNRTGKKNLSIITGYEVYLKRAERSGKLNGWQCVYNKQDDTATCTIYRKDWQYPLVHQIFANEVEQQSPIWRKMRTFMLKKVAIAQAFRLAFPDEIGGMPYTNDELPPNMTGETIEQPKKVEKTVKTEVVEAPKFEVRQVTPEVVAEIDKVAEQKEVLEVSETKILMQETKLATKKDILGVVDRIKKELKLEGNLGMQFITDIVGKKKASDFTVEDIAKLNMAIDAKKVG